MGPQAFAVVMVSALLHPTWNFLLKQSKRPFACLWTAVVIVTGALIPVTFILGDVVGLPAVAWFALTGATVFNAGYYKLLAETYRRGDLSRVYPFTRGMAPPLILVAEVLLLGAHPTVAGVAGVLLIVLGVYVLHLRSFGIRDTLAPIRALAEPISRLAMLNALCITGYSLMNKVALTAGASPLAVFSLANFAGVAILAPLGWQQLRADVTATWRSEKLRMFGVGTLQTVAYLLVLWAMARAPVGYVEAMRQVGIVFGTAAGVFLLREPFAVTRLAGSSLIVIGIIVIRVFG